MKDVMNELTILTIDDKVIALAHDIYDHARLIRNAELKNYQPSKQVSALLSLAEYRQIIEYLRQERYLSMRFIALTTPHSEVLPPYDMTINPAKFAVLLGITTTIQTPSPYQFDRTKSLLYIRGVAVKLARTEGKRPLAYYIAAACVKKPGKRISETDILDTYRPEYDATELKRSVESATRRLNSRIIRATGIKHLFVYSSGYVTFDDRQIENA